MAEPDRGGAAADGEEEEIVETDPEGRYYRYGEVVGRGRFKQIYKAFDTQIGIDVAWSKICAEPHHLSSAQLLEIVEEMTKGLELEHPNIIKCFKCWEDHERSCINLITELFTSGNLRQYRNLHKHLDMKAVKRMARQILRGLAYLHSMEPPLMHGDLRCDKIYVNGHSGEIKIGDLGLVTLIPLRWEADGGAPSPECADAVNRHDVRSDVFAFGLCMLELLTLKQLDPQHPGDPSLLLGDVTDEEAKAFIALCVGPIDTRPTADELLEDPFLQLKKPALPAPADAGAAQSTGAAQPEPLPNGDDGGEGEGHIAIGKLRGEDYNFEFHGKVKDGKMHFRLYMTQVSDLPATAPNSASTSLLADAAAAAEQQPPAAQPPVVRTIDFVFDPEVDTADALAAEISDEFSLSPTDTEICAAALREWLAKEMPGSEGGK